MKMKVHQVDWEYRSIFRIAQRSMTHSETVVVEIEEGQYAGWGEGLCVRYRGETISGLLDQLAQVVPDVRNGLTRKALQQRMPPGGARNALDCALWDLECKRQARRVWDIAGPSLTQPLGRMRTLVSAFTLGLDTPEVMARAATEAMGCPLLKIKLDGTCDLERVVAVRGERPDAEIIVDANQAWHLDQLREWAPRLGALGVTLIEQPLAVGSDEALLTFESPVPLCADESCQTVESLLSLRGKYAFINIKLDKTGGLTEALRLAEAAKADGFKLMVGCMGGSSLSMAPGFVIGQCAQVVDLDSPLLIRADVPHAIRYEGSRMDVPDSRLWG